jgi:hypothetical protein
MNWGQKNLVENCWLTANLYLVGGWGGVKKFSAVQKQENKKT